jgi:hypothetical protein
MLTFHTTTAPQPALGTETTFIIHESLGILMTYAFSKHQLQEFRDSRQGDWKHLLQ